MIKELVPVQDSKGKQTVNARHLHEYLNVGNDFTTWIKLRIEKYGFREGEDYTLFLKKQVNPIGGRPTAEYHISIDMAKELSMVENNDKGRAARKYFISCEKKLKSSSRYKSIETRNYMTDIWQSRGAVKPSHFINLTYSEYKAMGYDNPRAVKKDNMNSKEIARLNALESLEALKLMDNENIVGYQMLKESILETGMVIDSYTKKQIK